MECQRSKLSPKLLLRVNSASPNRGVSQLVQIGLPVLPNGRLDRRAALQWHRDNIIPPMIKNGEPNPAWDVLFEL